MTNLESEPLTEEDIVEVLDEEEVVQVENPEPLPTSATLLADWVIDSDQMMLDGVDTSKGPLYSISEMASFFFARSSHWVRWLESCHFTTGKGKTKKECPIRPSAHTKAMKAKHQHTWRFVLDGELLEAQRTSSGARKYDLALIEKIAHALASNGTIDVNQLRQALLLVKIQAEMNEYIKVEDPLLHIVEETEDLQEEETPADVAADA